MADTIREQIIVALGTQLAKITIANGYHYDMTKPRRGQKAIDKKYYPVSVYFPGEEENLPNFGKNNLTFLMRIESHIVIGTADPGVLQENMLGDLIKNTTDPTDKWSALIDAVDYSAGGPAEQPEAEDTTTAVFMLLSIKYKTKIGNPYSQ